MAALTRTSLTIFSRQVSDCQAEGRLSLSLPLSLHNSLDLPSFSLLAAVWQPLYHHCFGRQSNGACHNIFT